MALSQRFSEVTCDVVHISSLKVEQTYPIVKAEMVKNTYGETVLLSIRDPLSLSVRDLAPALLKVFYQNATRRSSRTLTIRQLMTNKTIGI